MHLGFTSTESPFDPGGKGGIASYLAALLPALVELGHRVTLVAFAGEQADFQVSRDLRVLHLRQPNAHWYLSKLGRLGRGLAGPARQLEWSWRFFRELGRVDSADRLDLVECTEVGGLYLSRIAPVVVRLHGSKFVFEGFSLETADAASLREFALQARLYRRAAALSSPSRFQAERVQALVGCPLNTVIIPNPLSPLWVQAPALDSAEPEENPPIVLYAGRLARVKGAHVLLEAIRKLRGSFLRFVLAGPWQLSKPPEAFGLDPQHGWRDGVRWLGYVPQEELLAWYRRAALFVMPSLYETFGIGVVEAMRMGVPVVASLAGALPEHIQHDVTGRLIPPGNSDALAQEIRILLDAPRERKRLAQAARVYVQGRFTPEQIARDTAAAYHQILSAEE